MIEKLEEGWEKCLTLKSEENAVLIVQVKMTKKHQLNEYLKLLIGFELIFLSFCCVFLWIKENSKAIVSSGWWIYSKIWFVINGYASYIYIYIKEKW